MSEPLDDLERAWRTSRSPESGAAYLAALTARLHESPKDVLTRLRLGLALYEQEEIDSAIPELQKSKSDPTTRAVAGYYLGYCFVKKKMAKLAISELNAVIAGAQPPLEGIAKDAAYLIGRIYEMAGKREQAIDHYRMIAPETFDPPGGMAGMPAPLRPGDPPRRPPDPPNAGMAFQ